MKDLFCSNFKETPSRQIQDCHAVKATSSFLSISTYIHPTNFLYFPYNSLQLEKLNIDFPYNTLQQNDEWWRHDDKKFYSMANGVEGIL